MKKLLSTLSILLLLLGSTILIISNKVLATDSNNPLTVYTNPIANSYEYYEEVNKENIDNNYKNNSLDYKYNEVITYVTSSLYNPLSNKYINSCLTENDEVYTFYSDKNLYNEWLVLIIDTKGNTNIKDDAVINSFYLNDYEFADN